MEANWQKIYHATLYKFSESAYKIVALRFSQSPIPVSRVCAYNEADNLFEISCPPQERQICLQYLSEIVNKYIEDERLVRTLNTKATSTITRIPASIVTKAHLDVEDEDEWDLTRDIGSDSQSSEANMTEEPTEIIEAEEVPISFTWTPEIGVQLKNMATRKILDELEQSSGCTLRLDDTAENLLIFSQDNDVIGRLSDRLHVLQNAFRRKPVITHVIKADGQPKFAFATLSKLGGGALGRILLPPQSDPDSDWDLDERLVLCSLRFDPDTQLYQIQKRNVKDFVHPTIGESAHIWHNEDLRDIGEAIVTDTPTPSAAPTSQVKQTSAKIQESALSRNVQQWMSTVETPKLSSTKAGNPEDSEKTLETILTQEVNQSGSETPSQMRSSKPYPWLTEMPEDTPLPRDLGPWAKTPIRKDNSISMPGSGAREIVKPFSITNPWGTAQKHEDTKDSDTTAMDGVTTWHQILSRPQRRGAFRGNKSYRSNDNRGRGHNESNQVTSNTRRSDSVVRRRSPHKDNSHHTSQRGGNQSNRRGQLQQSSSRVQHRGVSQGSRRSRSSTAHGSPSRHRSNNAYELISLDYDDHHLGEDSTYMQPPPGFGVLFAYGEDEETQVEKPAVMTGELIDLSESVEEIIPSSAAAWEPLMHVITSGVSVGEQIVERLAPEDDEISTRTLRQTMRQKKPPPKPSSKSAQSFAALNSLKEEYLTSVFHAKPKSSNSKLSETAPSTTKATKAPQAPDSSGTNQAKHVSQSLTETVKKALLIGKSFQGKVILEMQIGQILTSANTMPEIFTKEFDDIAELTSLINARGPSSFGMMHGVFTGSITSAGLEIELLLSLLGLEHKQTSSDTWWEFYCTDSNQKTVRIHLDAVKPDTKSYMTREEEVLGACYFHFPDRVWDARFIVHGSEYNTDLSAVEGAKELLESINFSKMADGSIEHTSLLGREESSTLNVYAVYLRRCLRYHAPPQFSGHCYIQFIRVEEWQVQRPNNDQSARGAFRAFREEESKLIKKQCLTHEVSLGLFNASYDDALIANLTLHPGDEAKWDVDEIVDEEALRSLEEFTEHVVKLMDPIGRDNKGLKAGDEKARKARMKALKEERKMEDLTTQWEALGHWKLQK